MRQERRGECVCGCVCVGVFGEGGGVANLPWNLEAPDFGFFFLVDHICYYVPLISIDCNWLSLN